MHAPNREKSERHANHRNVFQSQMRFSATRPGTRRAPWHPVSKLDLLLLCCDLLPPEALLQFRRSCTRRSSFHTISPTPRKLPPDPERYFDRCWRSCIQVGIGRRRQLTMYSAMRSRSALHLSKLTHIQLWCGKCAENKLGGRTTCGRHFPKSANAKSSGDRLACWTAFHNKGSFV